MTEWSVVSVIVVLVSLIGACTKPILDSTRAINSLNVTISRLQTMIEDDRKNSEAAHKRMGDNIQTNTDKIVAIDKRLENHDSRIQRLEDERKG